MISTDNIVRGFALCCAFVSAGLLLCLLLPLKLCYGIMCVIKMRVFLAVWGISPPVALRLPGLQNRTPDKVRSTAFIASQNSVTNACGMVNRIVNLPDDTSRKIIISSYD